MKICNYLALARPLILKVMENFIDPSSYKHFLILNGQKLEADVVYHPLIESLKKLHLPA